MGTKGQSGVVEAQTENEDQPQLAIVVEIVKLRKVVVQQVELMHKQTEEVRKREEKLAHRQNKLFDALTQRFPVPHDGNRPGPVVKYVR